MSENPDVPAVYKDYLNSDDYNNKFEQFAKFGIGHNTDGDEMILLNSDLWLRCADVIDDNIKLADFAIFFRASTLLLKIH